MAASHKVSPVPSCALSSWAFPSVLGRLLERDDNCLKSPLPATPMSEASTRSSTKQGNDQSPSGSTIDLDELVFDIGLTLMDLPENAFLLAATFLDASSLCRLDATSRGSFSLNQLHVGAWRELGVSKFAAIELESQGTFDSVARASRIDWKSRYVSFLRGLATFRSPFMGQEVHFVSKPDEVVYTRTMISTAAKTHDAVYMEIEILSNPDNISVAVVDFEAGGDSSLTFSPDTGAVIRERKIQDEPRKLEGSYVQPLPAGPSQEGFVGKIGIYFCGQHVAFLRQFATHHGHLQWETTGFVTDLSWAEGRCVTPCLAFRDKGAYYVRLANFGKVPPVAVGRPPAVYDESRWTNLDWEASDEDQYL